jgi:DNA gyrase subunit A
MIITKEGIMIRIAISDLRVMGRATQGVRLINLRDGDQIAAVTNVENGAEHNDEEQNAEVVDEGDATESNNETLENTGEGEVENPEGN